MRQPTYFLLAGLLDGPRHGYAIAGIGRELSSGGIGLSAGTLYGALGRLSDQGLIRPVEEVRVGGRRRRVYELTEDGRSELIEEAPTLRGGRRRHRAARAGEGGQAEIDRVAAGVPGGPRSAWRAGDASGPGAGGRPGCLSLGSLMTVVALPWVVLETTGSAARMSVVLAAELGAAAAAERPEARFVARHGPWRHAGGLRRPVGRHDGGDPAAGAARGAVVPAAGRARVPRRRAVGR